jgi:hypothetical protein
MLGLVCKPVKGTIDLVTKTTRGITNTPRSMYVGLSKMVKKVPKPAENPNEPSEVEAKIAAADEIKIGEQEGENIVISRSELK